MEKLPQLRCKTGLKEGKIEPLVEASRRYFYSQAGLQASNCPQSILSRTRTPLTAVLLLRRVVEASTVSPRAGPYCFVAVGRCLLTFR